MKWSWPVYNLAGHNSEPHSDVRPRCGKAGSAFANRHPRRAGIYSESAASHPAADLAGVVLGRESSVALEGAGQPILFPGNGGVASGRRVEGNPRLRAFGQAAGTGYVRQATAGCRQRRKARGQPGSYAALSAARHKPIQQSLHDRVERFPRHVAHSTLRIVSRNGQPWQVVRSALRRLWRGALFAQSIGREARACASHTRGQL